MIIESLFHLRTRSVSSSPSSYLWSERLAWAAPSSRRERTRWCQRDLGQGRSSQRAGFPDRRTLPCSRDWINQWKPGKIYETKDVTFVRTPKLIKQSMIFYPFNYYEFIASWRCWGWRQPDLLKFSWKLPPSLTLSTPVTWVTENLHRLFHHEFIRRVWKSSQGDFL